MDLALFEYDLPPALIAQEPAEPRDASRLLVLDRRSRGWRDRRFSELPDLLRPGDCVVVNTSRVIPARLLGEVGTRAAELLLVRELSGARWEALVRPGRRCRRGARIALAGGVATATVVEERPAGVRVVEIDAPAGVAALLERHGLPPLPPYIGRHEAPKPEDRERYQTVYARDGASVAAPTAGLHFTHELMARLAARGVEVLGLRLDVGPATFRPIGTARPGGVAQLRGAGTTGGAARAGEAAPGGDPARPGDGGPAGTGPRHEAVDVDAHVMEPEPIAIPPSTAEAIARAKAEGRRVVAVGTTTTRALESAADGRGGVRAGEGGAGLFIRPPHRFQLVDALVTNFHLPRSTLLVLVSAFADRELILAAYAHAVAAGYRFYSFGDAMLIE